MIRVAVSSFVAGRRGRRRAGPAALGAIALASVVSGCTVAPPPGAAPLRYRDQVFSDVTVTLGPPVRQRARPHRDAGRLELDLYRPTGDTRPASRDHLDPRRRVPRGGQDREAVPQARRTRSPSAAT